MTVEPRAKGVPDNEKTVVKFCKYLLIYCYVTTVGLAVVYLAILLEEEVRAHALEVTLLD